MPVLAKSDLFILSSRYEALGMVMLEADTLGIPLIATDINGTKQFVEKNNGHTVEMSAEGIYQGMKSFDRGEVKAMNVNYEKYNEKAV